jgi:ferredoxin
VEDVKGKVAVITGSGGQYGIGHIEVDRDRCMATYGCVHALPRLFGIGEDGTAQVIGPVDGDDEYVQDVVAECPTAALRLVRSDSTS